MNKYRVFVTFETFMGFSEDYFDVEAETSMEAIDKVIRSNEEHYDIEVQSVEPLD